MLTIVVGFDGSTIGLFFSFDVSIAFVTTTAVGLPPPILTAYPENGTYGGGGFLKSSLDLSSRPIEICFFSAFALISNSLGTIPFLTSSINALF